MRTRAHTHFFSHSFSLFLPVRPSLRLQAGREQRSSFDRRDSEAIRALNWDGGGGGDDDEGGEEDEEDEEDEELDLDSGLPEPDLDRSVGRAFRARPGARARAGGGGGGSPARDASAGSASSMAKAVTSPPRLEPDFDRALDPEVRGRGAWHFLREGGLHSLWATPPVAAPHRLPWTPGNAAVCPPSPPPPLPSSVALLRPLRSWSRPSRRPRRGRPPSRRSGPRRAAAAARRAPRR